MRASGWFWICECRFFEQANSCESLHVGKSIPASSLQDLHNRFSQFFPDSAPKTGRTHFNDGDSAKRLKNYSTFFPKRYISCRASFITFPSGPNWRTTDNVEETVYVSHAPTTLAFLQQFAEFSGPTESEKPGRPGRDP